MFDKTAFLLVTTLSGDVHYVSPAEEERLQTARRDAATRDVPIEVATPYETTIDLTPSAVESVETYAPTSLAMRRAFLSAIFPAADDSEGGGESDEPWRKGSRGS